MQDTSGIMSRLRDAATLPDALAAGFDAFEVIRQLARDYEDEVPVLFAMFMTAADAAVDGREAITSAPGLPPPGRSSAEEGRPGPSATAEQIAGVIARFGALLHDRLTRAVAMAAADGDRAACQDAAQAAGRICQLMAGGDDDSRPR